MDDWLELLSFDPFRYTLNEREIELASICARDKIKRQLKVNKGKYKTHQSNEDWYTQERRGKGAEIAFCRMFNIYPDTDIRDYAEPVDCVLPDGTTVDVKSTHHNGGVLSIEEHTKDYIVDIYALMTGEFPTYTFRGWIPKQDIIKPERFGNNHEGQKAPTYWMSQEELIKELCV